MRQWSNSLSTTALRLAAVLACGAACSAAAAQDLDCHPPAAINDGWEAAAPATSGFDAAALCSTLDAAIDGQYNIHGVVVERHGRLVAELYHDGPDKPMNMLFGLGNPFSGEAHFGPQSRHDVRSISKSVVSLLVGVARDKGQLGGLSSPVLDSYPDEPELMSPQRNRITLEHLLTMTSGLRWDESALPNDETRLYWTTNVLHFVFDRPSTAEPGEVFQYNSGGTAVLADILERSQQATLKALAREQLFEPMGITDWEWVADLHGRDLAFTGLRMRPRDMAKLGRLVLDHGQWRGRQIVSAAWIDTSTAQHVSTSVRLPVTAREQLGYGYQWWTGKTRWKDRSLAWSAAFGNGGQRIFVVPDLDLTLVITAGAYNNEKVNGVVNALLDRVVATITDPEANANGTTPAALTQATAPTRPVR